MDVYLISISCSYVYLSSVDTQLFNSTEKEDEYSTRRALCLSVTRDNLWDEATILKIEMKIRPCTTLGHVQNAT